MTWLYLPSDCVPVQECLTKDCVPDASFLASNSAPCVTSKGKPMQPASLLKIWKREHWMRRLSGLTLPHSTAQRGAEKFISSLPDFPASRTASLAPEKAQKMNAGSGKTFCESSAMWLLGAFFSKTSGAYFPVEGSRRSSDRWSPSGSILNGEYWPRPKLGPLTSVNGFSFWPTATTSMASGAGTGGRKGELNLQTAVALWPTATVCGNHNRKGLSKTSGDGLATAAKNWPTPATRDYKGANSAEHLTNGTGRLHLDQLPNYVEHIFLPKAQNQSDGGRSLPNNTGSRPRLNPAFVCHLMGWPIWWTHPEAISSAPAEMALYRSKQQLPLSYLLGEPELCEVAA